MALGGPGPRDWSPSGSTDAPPTRRSTSRPLCAPSSLLTAPRPAPQTRPWAYATLSMVLGTGSVVLAVAAPQHDGIASGFIVSTVGISAIVFGVHAVRRARWGSAASRAFGRGGSFLGGLGTVLMLYGLLAFALTEVGVTLPALSLPSTGAGVSEPEPVALVPTTTASAPAPTSPRAPAAAPSELSNAPTAVPVPAVEEPAAATAAQERSALAQSAGTLAYTMRQQFGTGPFPAQLLRAEHPGRLTTSDGAVLAPLPEATRVVYSVAPDGSAWSITLVGSSYGSVVTYSSTIGTVQSG